MNCSLRILQNMSASYFYTFLLQIQVNFELWRVALNRFRIFSLNTFLIYIQKEMFKILLCAESVRLISSIGQLQCVFEVFRCFVVIGENRNFETRNFYDDKKVGRYRKCERVHIHIWRANAMVRLFTFVCASAKPAVCFAVFKQDATYLIMWHLRLI